MITDFFSRGTPSGATCDPIEVASICEVNSESRKNNVHRSKACVSSTEKKKKITNKHRKKFQRKLQQVRNKSLPPIPETTTHPTQAQRWSQQTLDETPPLEIYGDSMPTKKDHVFRIGVQNINNLPVSAGHQKSKRMVNHIKNGQYDLFLVSEVGLRWNKIPSHDQWSERSLVALGDSTAVFSYNKIESHIEKTTQPGGTGIIATREAKNRINSRGVDSSGLGRWSWVQIQGKEGHTTMVLSAYRPCRSTTDMFSTFNQHVRCLGEHDNRDPLDAFREDLWTLLHEWASQGFHIVVGMDANENALDGEMSKMMASLGMTDVFVTRHGSYQTPRRHALDLLLTSPLTRYGLPRQ